MKTEKLAIDGGKPVRQKPLPSRRIFGKSELEMVKHVFQDSWKSGVDFSFQGKFEEQFTKKFCEFQDCEGFADAWYRTCVWNHWFSIHANFRSFPKSRYQVLGCSA